MRLLVFVAFQRGTKNIAQRGARVRAAILFHGLFLFGDLTSLDRQAKTAGLAVHVGHAHIDLVTDREPLGALLGAVTRQIGAADEGFHAFVFHLDAAILDRGHLDRDDRTALHAADSLGELVATQGLDRERDALFLDVHFRDDGLDDVALLVVLDGILAALVPAEVRQVNHAVDVAFEADEQTEFGDVLDFAFDLGARGMGFREHFPRVAHGLLEAQRHAALGLVDFQNHDLDFLRGRDDLAGMHVLLGPGHFRDVHQALDTGLQLNKGTVIGDVGHAAGMNRFQRVLGSHQIPRIVLQLLHAEADAVGFLVDLDDLHLDGLTDRQDFRRVVDATPGHVGDVQQAVNTAQIDKGAVFGDVLDDTIDILALGQVADHFGALLGAAFFQDGAARDNDVATAAIHLENLERLLETHQRSGIAHGAHIDLRAGQEGHGTAQIDGKATLDPAEDRAFDAGVVGIGFLQAVPGFLAAGHFTRNDGLATGVLDLAQEDFDFVTDRDVGRFAGICEFLEINAAFHLVADVDDGLSRFDRDDLAFDNRTLVGRVHFEAFVQKGLEFLHRCVLCHVAFQS